MANRSFALGCIVFVLGLAAIGCARTTSVGTTDEPIEPPAEANPVPQAPADPKHPSVISAAGTPSMLSAYTPLGDLDGDGFDDFFVFVHGGNGRTPYESMNLFYGRPKFPPALSADDSDAVFESQFYDLQPLGDVNGDGLADFAMRNADLGGGFEIVLGSRTRFSGSVTAGSVKWELPDFDTLLVPKQVSPAGDVNCDGIGDMIVIGSRAAQDHELGITGGFSVDLGFLVFGAAQLPSGPFQPSWAAAHFEPTNESASALDVRSPMLPTAAGDIDADGCDDLLVPMSSASYVFYGAATKFQGQLDTLDADAQLEPEAMPMLGDLDGDGATDFFVQNHEAVNFELTTMNIVYGGTRWSGRASVQSEFSIGLTGVPLYALMFAIGDIDMVGGPELLMSYAYADGPAEDIDDLKGGIFAMRGTGERRRGHFDLRDADPVLLDSDATASQFAKLGVGGGITVVGDVDGDGGSDILTTGITADQQEAVFLIPSTPRPPE